MPLYDFACDACESRFEAIASPGETPPCPACGSPRTRRVFSAFAGPFTRRPRGGDARRVDAQRRVREEQRSQRREERRQARESDGPRPPGPPAG